MPDATYYPLQTSRNHTTSSNPASVLQMHPAAKICVDEGAAWRLQRADYYRRVYEHKPDWQKSMSLEVARFAQGNGQPRLNCAD